MKKEIQQLSELSKEQINTEQSWLKFVLTMFSGIVSLLIVLHGEKSPTKELHDLYSMVLCIIGLGILTGLIYLYAHANTLYRLQKKYSKLILQSLYDNQIIPDLTVVEPYKFFVLMKWICYLSLFASVPLLIYYAILLDR